jgi:general secretion pathway protein G
MDTASTGRAVNVQGSEAAFCPQGLSLLEMMLVVTLILIIASMSAPMYRSSQVRAREAVLREHLFTMRFLIDRFTLDHRRSPAHLKELVTKGYLGRLPTDPFTGSNETWQEVKEPAPVDPTQTSPGIVDVHSGSDALALDGTPYRSW